MRKEGRVFVVTQASVRYRHPARLDDSLMVTATIEKVGRANLDFHQEVMCGDELLCDGHFTVACVGSDSMKPVSITKALRNLCLSVSNMSGN